MTRTHLWAGLILALAAIFASAGAPGPLGLNEVYAALMSKRFVDLTHSFGPDTPHWKGFGEMKRRTLYTIDKDGFQVDPKDMLMQLVVLDVHQQVARTTDTDPGLAVTKDDYSLESYVPGTNHYQIELLANLDQLPEAGALIMVMQPGALDPLVKELIYVAVSVTNNCRYCIASHTAGAWVEGMSEQQLAELPAVVGLANETNRLAIGYDVPVDERFGGMSQGA